MLATFKINPINNLLSLTIIFLLCVFINYIFYSASGEIYYDKINSFYSFNILNSIGQNLLNFTQKIEYIVEIDSNQIFPDKIIRNNVLENNKSIEYKIPSLQYELLGFKIVANDIQVITEPFPDYTGDKSKIRINFPVMNAKNVNVKGEMIDLSFDNIDLSSTYIIYNSIKDIFSIHIPINVAARYLPS